MPIALKTLRDAAKRVQTGRPTIKGDSGIMTCEYFCDKMMELLDTEEYSVVGFEKDWTDGDYQIFSVSFAKGEGSKKLAAHYKKILKSKECKINSLNIHDDRIRVSYGLKNDSKLVGESLAYSSDDYEERREKYKQYLKKEIKMHADNDKFSVSEIRSRMSGYSFGSFVTIEGFIDLSE